MMMIFWHLPLCLFFDSWTGLLRPILLIEFLLFNSSVSALSDLLDEQSKVRNNISQQTVHIVDNFLSFSKQHIMSVKVLQYGKLWLRFSVDIRNFGQRCWIAETELTIYKRCSLFIIHQYFVEIGNQRFLLI